MLRFKWDKKKITEIHTVNGLRCVVEITSPAQTSLDVVRVALYEPDAPGVVVGQHIWLVDEKDPKVVVDCLFNTAEKYQRKGIYTSLLSDLIVLWRGMGFEQFVIDRPRPGPQARALRDGFEFDGRGRLVGDLRPGGRLDEWREWKAGRAPEPEWRIEA